MKNFLLFFFFTIASTFSWGQDDCVPAKNDAQRLYDLAQLLDASQAASIEKKLEDFEVRTSNQVVIVISNDLCGMDISQYGTELIENWGVGQAKEDNGLAIILKPKTSSEKGEVNISTGRGMEGALPDGQCYLIEQNEMLPSFKQNDYFGGINKALDVIMELAAKEYTITEYAEKNKQKQKGNSGWGFLLVIIVVLIMMYFRFRKASKYARANGLDWWTAWMLLNQAGRSHRGTWGNFTGGSGGFGGWSGGGGGGFGGFGGGSSGGGGASSSW